MLLHLWPKLDTSELDVDLLQKAPGLCMSGIDLQGLAQEVARLRIVSLLCDQASLRYQPGNGLRLEAPANRVQIQIEFLHRLISIGRAFPQVSVENLLKLRSAFGSGFP